MTFAAGLRAILRQDPDIIMLGEIRRRNSWNRSSGGTDRTFGFTTLHTNDAVGAIPRLRDIGPDPGLLSDALLGIVAQRQRVESALSVQNLIHQMQRIEGAGLGAGAG
jgi:type II secretory ATPase GspE/PulE/Tfp pilus assembly ATPase PilB-like protein